jgi:hypothetical protein
MKHIKLFENFEETIFQLRNVSVIMHINGIIKLSVEKEHDSNIKIYNEVPNVGGYSIITFKQPSLDEYKTILEPYGYKITYGITGQPFENKNENKMLFIFDIGDYWYILSFYDLKQLNQEHYLIDDKTNLIKKIKELI